MRMLTGMAVALLTLAAEPAGARPQLPTPAPMAAERDALIGKIARGEDSEASVLRFAALQSELAAQREAAVQAELQEREQTQRAQKEQQELQRSLDYVVGQSCSLAVDPGAPTEVRPASLLHGDWGRVVSSETVTIKSQNAFAEDEHVSVYLVKGAARTYALSSKSPTLYLHKGLQAGVGDLVLLCWMSLSQPGSGSYFPEKYRENVISQGFAARLAGAPLIANKARWNPQHLTESELRLAIERTRWDYTRPVLSYIHVLSALGADRFTVAAQRQSYVLTVPGGLKNRELVQPGKYLWAIMSSPVFDKTEKKLVLRAEDLEEHYVQPRDEEIPAAKNR